MRLPFKRRGIETCRERSGDVRAGVGGHGILGIGAGHEIEGKRDIADRFPHRADGVVVGIERHHAGPARQPARRANGGERRKRRRVRQRVAGVGAEAKRSQAGGDGGGAAAARARGAERRIVGVADRAADRADAEIAERELVEVGLAEHDGAALLHAGGDARIEPRPMIDQRQRAAGRGQLHGVDVVLEDDRHAVKRAARAAGSALGIASARVGDGARVDGETERKVGP